MPAVLRRRTLSAATLVASVALPFAVVTPASASTLPAAVVHRAVLHPGDSGPAVAWLQRDLGVKTGGRYGDYGPLTLKAVEHFQAQYREWLADGSFSPFNVIIRIMAYNKGFYTKKGGITRII